MRFVPKKWQALVSETKGQNEIIRWNTIFLKHHAPRGEGFIKIGSYRTGINFEDIAGVVEQIEPLANEKLKKFLGKGAYGVVFELENNHIIKLFFEGRPTEDESELALYKRLQDAQFIGTATKRDPAIYSYGETSYEKKLTSMEKKWLKDPDNPPKLKWVEMGQIIPFEMWLEITGREESDINDDFFELIEHLSTLFTKDVKYGWREGDEDFLKAKIEKITQDNSVLTKQEWVSFMHMALHIMKTHGPERVGDLHSGNFGISMQDKKTMVAYDF